MKYLTPTIILCLFPTLSFADAVAPVNVTVAPTCSLENQEIDIGSYNRTSGNLLSASIKHSCSPEVSYSITLSGSNSRKLTHIEKTNEQASIYIYQGNDKNRYFGTGSNRINAVGTGETESSPILIEVPAGQNLASGKYKGVFNMFITY